MSESRYDDENWTWEEFLEKLDSEGGIEDMLNWGGPGCFPPEIREDARAVNELNYRISQALNDHGY